MEYNSTRSRMAMPEYGRNVQAMAEHLLTIEDPQQRLKAAEYLIEVMTILTPHLKTIEEYKHKLWDHLYQMTDFRLEVEGPFSKPLPEDMRPKPQPLPYPQAKIKHRHLGKTWEPMLERAMAEPDDEKRQQLTQLIGYFMKLAYANWHKEPVHDDMIRNELIQISDGKLLFEPAGYRVHVDMRPEKSMYGKRGKKPGQRPQQSANFNRNKGKYRKGKM